VQFTAWSKDLRVTADGIGVVSHVGTALLGMLADRAGLTGALSPALARTGVFPVHDRGRVLVDLAVLIADAVKRSATLTCAPPAESVRAGRLGHHRVAGVG